MKIYFQDLLQDPTLNQEQLQDQIRQLEDPYKYNILHLTDTSGYARVGIVELSEVNINGTKYESIAYERHPFHEVTTRGNEDSYDGLYSILTNGFKALIPNDTNATIFIEDDTIRLQKIASLIERPYWAVPSKNSETKGDIYILKFRRFSPVRNWGQLAPSPFYQWEFEDISINRAETPDINVNVFLGTENPEEIKQRIQKYERLFRKHSIMSRYHLSNK